MKHTQGKWEVESAGKILAIATSEQLIAIIENKNTDNKEAIANAKLIASAPEMLEALIKINNAGLGGYGMDVVNAVKNAIKQATE